MRQTGWAGIFAARVGSTLDYLRGRAPADGPEPPLGRAYYIPYFIAMGAHHALGLFRARMGGLPADRLPFFSSRTELLRAAAERAPKEGVLLEFGVFRGRTIRALAAMTTRTVHGFDSFEGLPARWGAHFPPGRFDTRGAVPDVPPNVRLWRGWFSQTIPRFLREVEFPQVALLHIDCDLYASAKEVLNGLRDRIRAETVIVFDEFVTPYPDDESRAFREFLSATGYRARYFGSSRDGSVGVQIV